VIEYRTSRPGEMQAVADEWAQATEGKRKAGRRGVPGPRGGRDDQERIEAGPGAQPAEGVGKGVPYRGV
jgi:hypothetical protein